MGFHSTPSTLKANYAEFCTKDMCYPQAESFCSSLDSSFGVSERRSRDTVEILEGLASTPVALSKSMMIVCRHSIVAYGKPAVVLQDVQRQLLGRYGCTTALMYAMAVVSRLR